MIKKLPFIFILITVYCLLFTSSIYAQNKCGVNIGPNYQQADQVAGLTGQGGWLVSLGSTGNCDDFSGLFGKNLNIIIRAYNGGQPFTNEQALGWIATLGKINSAGQIIYFMPWNEPNHANEGGGPNAGNQAYQYSIFLQNTLGQAGLLDTKIKLLSPMVDKLNQSFINDSFFNNPGGKAGFYNLFNGHSSINQYDQFSPGPCSAPAPQNNCQYDQVGIPADYYALETGVAGTCTPPCYNDWELTSMLNTAWPKWSPDNSFKMFAIFSYDPHRSGWDIFSAPHTKAFYKSSCTAGGVTSGGFDEAKFNAWLQPLLDDGTLIPCPSGCGYAHKDYPEMCNPTGGKYIPLICKPIPGQDSGIDCAGPPISMDGKVYYTHDEGECITRTFSGDIKLSGLDIPFSQNLADYFTGIFDFDHISQDQAQQAWQECADPETFNSCWQKIGRVKPLTTSQQQNTLKKAFLNEISARVQAGKNSRYENFQIQNMGPQAILSRFEQIEKKAWNKKGLEDEKFLKEVWNFIPLFSNEESQGAIAFSGDGVSGSVDTSIPDVYRLSKATSFLQDMLLPKPTEPPPPEGAFKKNQPLIANSAVNNNAPGIWIFNLFKNIFGKVKKVFAEDCQINCLSLGINNVSYENGMIKYNIQACHTCPDYTNGKAIGDVSFGPCGNRNHVQSIWPPCSTVDWWAAVPPIPASCPGTYTICVSAKPDRDVHKSCQGIEINHSCQVTLDDNCQITETTCGGIVPPTDTCPETPDSPENKCEDEAQPGPPQTPCCTDLETQQYPNFFGARQFKNDCAVDPGFVPDCGCYYDSAQGKCVYDTACGTSGEFKVVDRGCNPLANLCQCRCEPKVPDRCEKPFSINVNITNTVPFLTSIARQTIDPLGIYRIFIPWAQEKDYLQATESEINEKLKEMDEPIPGEDPSVSYALNIKNLPKNFEINYPGSGSFRALFEYLATVYNIKNWISNKVLLPKELGSDIPPNISQVSQQTGPQVTTQGQPAGIPGWPPSPDWSPEPLSPLVLAKAPIKGVGVCHAVMQTGGKIDWAYETSLGRGVFWRELEPSPGEYYFGGLDQLINQYKGQDVKIWLAIQTVSADLEARPKAPDWMMANWITADCKHGIFAPWDQHYQDRLYLLLKAVNDHISSQPQDYQEAVGGIMMMSGGMFGEMQLWTCNMEQKLMQTLGLNPNNPAQVLSFREKYYQAVLTLADIYVEAFPNLPIALQLGYNSEFYHPETKEKINLDWAVSREVISKYKNHFILKFNGLAPTNFEADGLNQVRTRQNNYYKDLFNAFSNQTQVGYETKNPNLFTKDEHFYNVFNWALDSSASFTCFQGGELINQLKKVQGWEKFDYDLEKNIAD